MFRILLLMTTTFVFNRILAGVTDFPLTSTRIPYFVCVDGTNVELFKACNGLPDCPDSSDELRELCHHIVCPASNYRCSYGACVQKAARCDGYLDCIDGSDEYRCDLVDVCTDREYACLESLECLPLGKICDGYADCGDGSDENETLCKAYPCPPNTYRCTHGGCVYQETICDGTRDCTDGSDEEISMCASTICQGSDCPAHTCREDEFRCESSSQCIPTANVCDGVYQCHDASDEREYICATRECDSGFFRCNYGGCILDSLKCNLQPNCHDWSDEDEAICGTSIPDGGCRLPPAKPATHYVVSNCPECHPGQVVPELTRLDYSCDTLGSLEGSSSVYCRDNHWTPTLPWCITDTQDITCTPVNAPGAKKRCEVLGGMREGWIPCNGTIPVGTHVTLECPEFYERLTGSTRTTCLHDGTWSQLPLRCQPICGIRESSAAALIIKGWELFPEESLPWHATLFSHDDGQWNFFCGGTLISERAVLTAGHCVWRTDEKTIQVSLAAFSRNFTNRSANTQVLEVERLEMQTAYQDHIGNYGSDLAVLILKWPTMINSAVMPICLDWSNSIDVLQRSGQIGLVAGMGITDNDTVSETLRVTSVKLVSEDECRNSQKKDFWKYITYTSFCAGWLNGSAVCNGDSGGGLVFRRTNSTIWDLHGVVSISPRRVGTTICDPHYYTIFTKIVIYSDWIMGILNTLPVIGPPDTELMPNSDVVLNY